MRYIERDDVSQPPSRQMLVDEFSFGRLGTLGGREHMVSGYRARDKATITGNEGRDAFVGRRRELELIKGTLEAAAKGSGRLEVLSGPPGIGKTRLSHEAAAIAQERGFCVLLGRCWDDEGAPSYWPWAEVLRNYLRGKSDAVPRSGADFGHLLDIAAAQAKLPERGVADASKDAQQARFMLFDRFCEVVNAAAAVHPMLVIIDDAQSADTGSLLLLQFLTERLPKLPMALLVTSREPLSQVVASAAREPWGRHCILRGLSRADARVLLKSSIPRPPRPSAFDRLMQLTEGNPYFLKELGQLLAEPSNSADEAPLAWPASLLNVTLQPYDRLSAPCRSLLQAASVVGLEFEIAVTAQAACLRVHDALALLDEAVERRVIVSLGGGRYHFAHALVREAIHDQLHPSECTRLHQSTAVALERRVHAGDAISPATLAHHFAKGLPLTQRRQAAAYSTAAGDSAYSTFAYEEAVFQYRRAQELSGTSLTNVEACDLLLRLGAAEAGAGEWSRSRCTFEDAADLARRINCPERLAHAALGFKGMMWATYPIDSDAISMLEEARLLLGTESLDLQVRLLSTMARSLHFSNDQERIRDCSDTAMKLAARIPNDTLRAIALEAHTMGLLRPGHADDLRASAATLVTLSDRVRNPELRFNARIFHQAAMLNLGEMVEADAQMEIASQIADGHPHPRFKWQMAVLRVARATLRGHLSQAERLSATAQELGERVHDSSPVQYHLLQGFQRAQFRSEIGAWVATATTAIENLPAIPALRAAHAWILARAGHVDLANEILHELGQRHFAQIPANILHLWLLTVLADVAALVGSRPHAKVLYELLLPHAARFIVVGWGTLLDGSISHYLGVLAHLLELDSVASHYNHAIEANRRIGAPILTARSSVHLARHLRSLGLVSEANVLAKGAAATFASLGLPDQADEAQKLRTGHGTAARTAQHLSPLEAYAFRRSGDYWQVAFRGHTTLLRATRGLGYLSVLLARPGVPVHALDLATMNHASSQNAQQAQPKSDKQARDQYRSRLRELAKEIESADCNNDIGLRCRLVEERDALVDELSHSFSVSGAPRASGSDAERARISVRNRIASSLLALRGFDPECANFIQRSVKTGVVCVYDPIEPIHWAL